MKTNILHKIAKIIADEFQVEPKYIFKDTRKHKVTEMRCIFHFMAQKYTSYTLQKIGDFSEIMGRGKPHNHATVIYGYAKVRRLVEVDKEFKEKVLNIVEKVERQLTYDKYVSKKSSLTISNIIDKIFFEDDYEYLDSLDNLINLLYENKEKGDIDQLILQQKATNERVHQATSDNSGLGMV